MTKECLSRIPKYLDLYLDKMTWLKRQQMTYELIEQGAISINESRCKSQNVVGQANKTLFING